jgi:hypothetical protein
MSAFYFSCTYFSNTTLVSKEPPTCILIGALGEDNDDCTTHEHSILKDDPSLNKVEFHGIEPNPLAEVNQAAATFHPLNLDDVSLIVHGLTYKEVNLMLKALHKKRIPKL